MKYIVFITSLSILSCIQLFSQNNIEQMVSFRKNADMSCYYKMIERNVNEYFEQWHKDIGLETSITYTPCPKIYIQRNERDTLLMTISSGFGKKEKPYMLRKSHIIPILATQFVCTDTFDINDNICDYLRIDSTRVFVLASVDGRDFVNAYVHFYHGNLGYEELHCDCTYDNWGKSITTYNRKRRLIKRIKKLRPELIMLTQFGLPGWLSNSILYLKNSVVYLYDERNNESVELDKYIKQHYSVNDIRKFNIYYIPYIYIDKLDTRVAGNTPPEQINICK